MSSDPPGAADRLRCNGRRLPLAFWVVLVLSVAVRSVGIDRPLVGDFATKNALYAMIARNWVEARTSLWYPALDLLADDGQRLLYMQEFPASAYVTGWFWKVFGGSLDTWGRATSVVLMAASVAILFLFVHRRHGPTAALGASLVLALSPVSIIYGQAFLLQASVVFFTVAAVDCLDRWLGSGRSVWLVVAAISLALLILTKIYMLVVLLPLAAAVVRSVRSAAGPDVSAPVRRRSIAAIVAAVAAITPAAVWYWHVMRTAAPDGPFAGRIYYSILHSAAGHGFPHPLLCSADFYRQILDDLTTVVLTPIGFSLVLAGLIDRRWRQHALWFVAMLLLVVGLPRKFYEMNYYYMAVLPPLCIMAGIGWQLIRRRIKPSRMATAGLLIVAAVLSARYAVRPAFVTPDEDRGVLAAGRAVQELTSEGEPVVTMHGWAIDLIYHCDRPGWVVSPDTPQLDSVLEEYRRRGARYLAVAGPEATNKLPAMETQTTVLEGDGFCIYRLAARQFPADR